MSLNIYCSLQTDLEVLLKPGEGLVSVQVARILGQKATEITLHEKKKSMTWSHQFQEVRLHTSGHGDRS